MCMIARVYNFSLIIQYYDKYILCNKLYIESVIAIVYAVMISNCNAHY